MTQQDWLRQAIALARQGTGRTSPNPTVGAILVREGRIAGQGFHTWAGVKHAEILALEQAGEQARGATLYLSLEPCCHAGRTGPCVDALIKAGVAEVVVPGIDPNPLVAGKGLEKLRAAGVRVTLLEPLALEAEALNPEFFHAMRNGRPLVTLKAALTLDGKIAAPEDNSGWITSEKARAHVQQLRHRADAILTGVNTVLADDCLLTDRSGLERSRPLLRVVVDSVLRLPLDSKMVRSAAGDLLVVCTSVASHSRRKALEDAGAELLIADGPDGRTNLAAILPWLHQRQYSSLMIEAGSKVNWAALEAGIVDRVFFYYAPKILGGTQSLPVAGGRGRRSRTEAIKLHRLKLHPIPGEEEFAVEAWLERAAG